MEKYIGVHGPRHRNTENLENLILLSLSAEYRPASRTQQGLRNFMYNHTEEAALHVYTSKNGETRGKKIGKEMRSGSSMYSVGWCQKEQRHCFDFPTLLLASTAPHLFNAHFLMQIFQWNTFHFSDSRCLHTMFCSRNISSIQA
jgi:hypothetical protein